MATSAPRNEVRSTPNTTRMRWSILLAAGFGAGLAGLPVIVPGMPGVARYGIYIGLVSATVCAAAISYRRRRTDFPKQATTGTTTKGPGTAAAAAAAFGWLSSPSGHASHAANQNGNANANAKGNADALRVFTEASAAAILFLRDGKVAYANAAAQALLGGRDGDLIGTAFRTFVTADHLGLLRLLDQAPEAKPGVTPRAELLLKGRQQQPRWMDVSLSPVDFEGRLVWSINAFDVHDRKLAGKCTSRIGRPRSRHSRKYSTRRRPALFRRRSVVRQSVHAGTARG